MEYNVYRVQGVEAILTPRRHHHRRAVATLIAQRCSLHLEQYLVAQRVTPYCSCCVHSCTTRIWSSTSPPSSMGRCASRTSSGVLIIEAAGTTPRARARERERREPERAARRARRGGAAAPAPVVVLVEPLGDVTRPFHGRYTTTAPVVVLVEPLGNVTRPLHGRYMTPAPVVVLVEPLGLGELGEAILERHRVRAEPRRAPVLARVVIAAPTAAVRAPRGEWVVRRRVSWR